MSWRLLASAFILAALALSLVTGGRSPAALRRASNVESSLQDVYARYGRRPDDTWLSALDDSYSVGRYEGWVMLSICCVNSSQQPSSQQELLNQLLVWEKDGVATITDDGLLDGRIQLAVAPPVYPLAVKKLNHLHLSYDVVSEDIESLITTSFSRSFRAEKIVTGNFYELHEVENFLKELQRQYPDQVKLKVVGESLMKRPILQITVLSQTEIDDASDDQQDNEPKNSTVPIILIDSAMHSREWLTVATSLYALQTLLENPASLLRAVEWRFIPVVNPDGYLYSWEKNRFWRKNRRPHADSACVGVDINRNFDVGFGGVGASSEPCSDEFLGEASFSEPETQAVRDAVQEAGDRLKMYLSLHSYGQLFLLPWAYTASHRHDNLQNMTQLAQGMADAIHKVNKTEYFVGTIWEGLYPASGISSDWVAAQGIPNSIVVELQDKGRNGFLWPESEIEQAVTETWEGLKFMGEEIWRRYVNDGDGSLAPNIPPVRNDVPEDVNLAIRDRIIALLQLSGQILAEEADTTASPTEDLDISRIVEVVMDSSVATDVPDIDSNILPNDTADQHISQTQIEETVNVIDETSSQEIRVETSSINPLDLQESMSPAEEIIVTESESQVAGAERISDDSPDNNEDQSLTEKEVHDIASNSEETIVETTPSDNLQIVDKFISLSNTSSSDAQNYFNDNTLEAASIASLFDEGIRASNEMNVTEHRNATTNAKDEMNFVLLQDFVPQVVSWSENVEDQCKNDTNCKISSYIKNVLENQASRPSTETSVATESATETVTDRSPDDNGGRKKIVLKIV